MGLGMRCAACGVGLPAGARFCPHCGTARGQTSAPATHTEVERIRLSRIAEMDAKIRTHAWEAGAAALGGLTGLGIILVGNPLGLLVLGIAAAAGAHAMWIISTYRTARARLRGDPEPELPAEVAAELERAERTTQPSGPTEAAPGSPGPAPRSRPRR